MKVRSLAPPKSEGLREETATEETGVVSIIEGQNHCQTRTIRKKLGK